MRLGSPIAFALFALAPPSSLVGFDGSRFAAGLLNISVEITEKEVRPIFSSTQLGCA